jgi:hypothetical protein
MSKLWRARWTNDLPSECRPSSTRASLDRRSMGSSNYAPSALSASPAARYFPDSAVGVHAGKLAEVKPNEVGVERGRSIELRPRQKRDGQSKISQDMEPRTFSAESRALNRTSICEQLPPSDAATPRQSPDDLLSIPTPLPRQGNECPRMILHYPNHIYDKGTCSAQAFHAVETSGPVAGQWSGRTLRTPDQRPLVTGRVVAEVTPRTRPIVAVGIPPLLNEMCVSCPLRHEHPFLPRD